MSDDEQTRAAAHALLNLVASLDEGDPEMVMAHFEADTIRELGSLPVMSFIVVIKAAINLAVDDTFSEADVVARIREGVDRVFDET